MINDKIFHCIRKNRNNKIPRLQYRLSRTLVVSFSQIIILKKLLWLLPLSFILSACPFESTVPLEPAPVEHVDTSLFGYWYGIVKDGSDFFGIEALDITKQSDSIYSIIRYGKAIKGDFILPDTSYYTGFTSWIGGDHFMNVAGSIVTMKTRGKKPAIMTREQVYYLSKFEIHHDTLKVRSVIENFSPRKIFNSPDQLKETITGLINQQKNIFDDTYSMSYRKIEKPQPLKPL